MNPSISQLRLRNTLLNELDQVPREQALAVVSETLIFLCFDFGVSVEDFDFVLDEMRRAYAQCK